MSGQRGPAEATVQTPSGSRRVSRRDAIRIAASGAVAGAALGPALATSPAGAAGGAAWKDPVRVATTANGALSTAFAAGQVVDGVTLTTGDRILLKNQTSGAENGIYVVPPSGTPSRASDAATGADLVAATVLVLEGETNGGAIFACSTVPPITLGTTALAFSWKTLSAPAAVVSSSPFTGLFGPAKPLRGAAPFNCTGTGDQDVINDVVVLLAINGGGTIELTEGVYYLSAPIVLYPGVNLVGQGGNTRLTRTADTVMLKGSGTKSNWLARNRVEDLVVDGNNYGSTAFFLKYVALFRLSRVNFTAVKGHAIEGMGLQDSTVTQCRFDWCGTDGAGTRKSAVRLASDGEPSPDGCNNLHFSDCTWENFVDGALEIAGTASGNGNVNLCSFTECKMESHFLYGPAVTISVGHYLCFRSLRTIIGSLRSTQNQPQDIVRIADCIDVVFENYSGVCVDDASPAQSVRTFLAFQGGNTVMYLDRLAFMGNVTNRPSVAAIEFSGTNNKVGLGDYEYTWNPSGAALVSGMSTLTQRFRSRGSVTIPSGSTTAVVTHQLCRTPDPGEIVLTLTNQPTNDPGPLRVTSIGTTTFTVGCRNDPGSSGAAVAWSAIAG